jgi:hypothetical protein
MKPMLLLGLLLATLSGPIAAQAQEESFDITYGRNTGCCRWHPIIGSYIKAYDLTDLPKVKHYYRYLPAGMATLRSKNHIELVTQAFRSMPKFEKWSRPNTWEGMAYFSAAPDPDRWFLLSFLANKQFVLSNSKELTKIVPGEDKWHTGEIMAFRYRGKIYLNEDLISDGWHGQGILFLILAFKEWTRPGSITLTDFAKRLMLFLQTYNTNGFKVRAEDGQYPLYFHNWIDTLNEASNPDPLDQVELDRTLYSGQIKRNQLNFFWSGAIRSYNDNGEAMESDAYRWNSTDLESHYQEELAKPVPFQLKGGRISASYLKASVVFGEDGPKLKIEKPTSFKAQSTKDIETFFQSGELK